MNVRFLSIAGRILVLGLALGASGCGSGGGGGSSSSSTGMSIVSCSLGCTAASGPPGAQYSCGVTEVFVNQEIRLEFTNPVDLTSVNNNSFQVVEAVTGKTPPGAFAVASDNTRTLIYRPQLSFDSSGNPIFGLSQDKTYFLRVPGSAVDSLGPFIRGVNGSANASRMQCTLVASRGVFDARPGRPRVALMVDVVTGYDPQGNPVDFDLDVPAGGADNVFRDTIVHLEFDDVMNPGTLANPVTGTSDFIRAFIDPDGDVSDRSDEVSLSGVFSLTIDQTALRTMVDFEPSGGLPSAGTLPDTRRIVIELSPLIVDLGGNTLQTIPLTVFTPERIAFEEREIGESFDDAVFEDPVRTGSSWAAGRLATGPGGGSGRLGDLVVFPGQVIELNTDFEDFAELTDPASFDIRNAIDPPTPLTVTGGVFEFARLRIDSGGVLRFRGTHPARIYVRGEAVIQGLLDVSGTNGILHTSNTLAGGTGGTPGPNGGKGGNGGSRPDGTLFVSVGGAANPGAGPTNVLNPATYNVVNGEAGGGIAFPSTLVPTPSFVAKGGGGLAWPQPTAANPALHMPGGPTDVSGLQVEVYQECRYTAPGAPGGGGAYSFDGEKGDAQFGGLPTVPITLVPDTAGGESADLAVDDTVRTLSPELGLLRGGAGGGGGGAHLQRTQINGLALVNCNLPVPAGQPLKIVDYLAHSSAGGGAGGGALQVAAGRRILVGGIIDASGGDGGSGSFPPDPQTPNDLAQAGGGGAGGSVLLQSSEIRIAPIPARVIVSGGKGGEGTGNPFPVVPSTGGDGSPGFLRLEAETAPSIASEETKVSPRESEIRLQYGPSAEIEDVISSVVWQPVTDVPSGWSGAESCWIRPTGNFFKLVFADDSNGPGWDMELGITGQATPQSFRGPNDVFPGMTLEQVFGTDFGTSPILVRFQSARAVETLVDPCSVPESGPSSPLSTGSRTEWVRHPSLLNDFNGQESLTPNVMRFLILWDRSQVDFNLLEAVESLTIRVRPD